MSMERFITHPDPGLYFGGNYLVLDFETDTSHGDYGHPVHKDNKLLLACWRLGPEHPAYGRGAAHFCWGGEYEQQLLLEHIAQADFIVAHNTKYELGWLRRCGQDLRRVLPYCTQIGEYVLAGNLAAIDDKSGVPRVGLSLQDLCLRRGLAEKDPITDKLIKGDVNPIFIPRPWLLGRCIRDVETTEQVFLQQRVDLAESGRLGVAYTRNLLTPVLAAIEMHGMKLDPEAVTEEWEKYTRELAELESELNTVTGGINWNSPDQVAHYIYDVLEFDELRDARGNVLRNKKSKKYPEGSRKTDKDTLEALEAKAKTPKQLQFVQLKREVSKRAALLSKNLNYFMGICKEYDGLMYAVFNQTRTATHRLSSTGVETWFKMFQAFMTAQMQNIPRIFKRLFMARLDGWKVAEADGASIEFRGAGILTRDPQIREDVINHADIHRFTAATLNAVEESEVTGEQRQDAKPDTFKPLYGGQSGTPAQQRYYAAFREKYSRTAETQARWVDTVLRDKVLETEWGLRYYWPYAKRSKSGYVNCTSNVYNYPIQAFATAEVIPIAVVYFWHLLGDAGLEHQIKLVNTIHDSIICEIHPDAEDEWRELSKRAFGPAVYFYLKKVYGMDVAATGIPLGVGMKVGDHWNTGEEQKWDLFADGRMERYE